MGYLYRAVDKQGKTVDSLFQTGRGIAAAMAFFRKRLRSAHHDGRGKLHWMDTNQKTVGYGPCLEFDEFDVRVRGI
jgi:transposase-like protein